MAFAVKHVNHLPLDRYRLVDMCNVGQTNR
jgi:hypothetical protein